MKHKSSSPGSCPATFIQNVARGFREQCTNTILIDSNDHSPHGTIVRGTCRGTACVEFLVPGLNLSCSENESRSFFVYGVVSELRKAKNELLVLRSGALVDCLNCPATAPFPSSETASVSLSIDGARYLLPGGEHEYEFSFATVVESIDSFDFLGSTVYRMHAVLMMPDDIPFNAVICAPKIALRDFVPGRGDSVQGSLLLFGMPVERITYDPEK